MADGQRSRSHPRVVTRTGSDCWSCYDRDHPSLSDVLGLLDIAAPPSSPPLCPLFDSARLGTCVVPRLAIRRLGLTPRDGKVAHTRPQRTVRSPLPERLLSCTMLSLQAVAVTYCVYLPRPLCFPDAPLFTSVGLDCRPLQGPRGSSRRRTWGLRCRDRPRCFLVCGRWIPVRHAPCIPPV